MNNDKLDEALAQVTLGLFILQGRDFNCLNLFVREDLSEFLTAVTELVDVLEDES